MGIAMLALLATQARAQIPVTDAWQLVSEYHDQRAECHYRCADDSEC